MTPTSPPSTGLLRRFGAIFYDSLILIAVLMFATVILLPLSGGEAIDSSTSGYWFWVYRGYLVLIVASYFAVSWRLGGQTIGMKAWKIRLVSEPDGIPTWRQSFLRCSLAIVSWAMMGAGFWWVWISNDRRAWHDLGSATYLVKVQKTLRGDS